jgi:hypothetical protein
MLAVVAAVGACKSSGSPSTPALSNEPSTIADRRTATGTAVFLSTTRSALLVGCATDDASNGDRAACLALVQAGDALADRYGRVFSAGKTGKHQCSEGAGKTSYVEVADVALPDDYEGPRIGNIDPRTDLVVFPARRARDLVLAVAGDDGKLDRAAAAALLRRAAARMTTTGDENERKVSPAPGTLASLRADLDGDRVPDTVWGVEGNPSEDYGINGLFAELSRTRGLVLLRAQMPQWQEPLAAIDVDGDGVAELIHHSHYAEAEDTMLSRIVDGALVPIGECCCAEQ